MTVSVSVSVCPSYLSLFPSISTGCLGISGLARYALDQPIKIKPRKAYLGRTRVYSREYLANQLSTSPPYPPTSPLYESNYRVAGLLIYISTPRKTQSARRRRQRKRRTVPLSLWSLSLSFSFICISYNHTAIQPTIHTHKIQQENVRGKTGYWEDKHFLPYPPCPPVCLPPSAQPRQPTTLTTLPLCFAQLWMSRYLNYCSIGDHFVRSIAFFSSSKFQP